LLIALTVMYKLICIHKFLVSDTSSESADEFRKFLKN